MAHGKGSSANSSDVPDVGGEDGSLPAEDTGHENVKTAN
jgi:hypothetical protein